MTDCSDCGVDAGRLQAAQRRVLIAVMLINFATFGGMIFASWLSGSAALLSGTLDNLGDALTYGLSLAVVGAGSLAKARVALFKGLLISLAAVAVATQIGWRLLNLEAPLATTMSVAAGLNLAANAFCLWLLTPHRHDDVNMASVWECSRNDILEGIAVLLTAAAVWLTESAIPDLLIAAMLLVLFSRSAFRVLSSGIAELRQVRHAT